VRCACGNQALRQRAGNSSPQIVPFTIPVASAMPRIAAIDDFRDAERPITYLSRHRRDAGGGLEDAGGGTRTPDTRIMMADGKYLSRHRREAGGGDSRMPEEGLEPPTRGL
jgi:hypothetical protein